VRSREQGAIDAAIAELRSADDAIVEAGRAVEGHVERTRAARAELDRSRATLADARIEEARATAERESLMRDLDRLDREQHVLEERVTAARRRLALPPPVAPADPEEAPARPAGDDAHASDDRRATARQRLETLRRSQAEEDEALTAALEEEREASAVLAQARVAVDEASARASESRSTVEHDRDRVADLTARRDAAEGAHRAAASAAARAEERLRAVEQQLGDAEGPAAGSKADAALIRGLHVEPRLQAAVEAALGAAVNASVAGTDAVSEGGSARPLVLRDLAGPPLARDEGVEVLTTAVREGGGALGDALRSDPSGIGRRILQRALWVPDLQAALRVARHLPAGWLVVTAAGERIDAVGVLEPVPGSFRLALEEERARLAAELPNARAGTDRSASGLEAAEAALREARDLLAGHEAAWATLEAERRTRIQAQDGAERRAELAAREAAWARVQQERRTTEVARLEAVLGDGSSASPPRPESAAEWKIYRDAVRERQRLEGGVAADTQRSTTVAAERDAVAEALARAEPERVRLAALIGELEAGVAERVTALAALDVQEASGRERLDAAERVRRMAGERLQAAEGRARGAEIAELEARMSLDAVRERLLVELASLGPVGLAALTVSRTTGDPTTAMSSGTPVMVGEGARAGADETIVSRLEAALTSVEGEWSAAPPAAEPPSPGRVASLRRRYQEVGVENPFAAEEHAEISARLTDLETQRDDLLRAIAATRELIADLERLIIDQFQTTFRALETAFERRFSQLFGGGTAKLSLTDPADPAASGVEIVARPPGKKAQALAMLSGGERALTAVALLFAMLEVRPVPFCVLDEVDAALDEANIGRFAAALRDLAATIQFVVITHNRGTIEQADALYGVTIGDDAVSRVISLRLEPGDGDARAATHPATIGVEANGRQAAGSSGNVERVS
jgi:chromosome segregation protein